MEYIYIFAIRNVKLKLVAIIQFHEIALKGFCCSGFQYVHPSWAYSLFINEPDNLSVFVNLNVVTSF